MAHLASMMSAFDAAWSLLKARDDRLVHGRMTAPPPIVGMMERLRNPKDEEGNPLPSMLGEAGDVRDQRLAQLLLHRSFTPLRPVSCYVFLVGNTIRQYQSMLFCSTSKLDN